MQRNRDIHTRTRAHKRTHAHTTSYKVVSAAVEEDWSAIIILFDVPTEQIDQAPCSKFLGSRLLGSAVCLHLIFIFVFLFIFTFTFTFNFTLIIRNAPGQAAASCVLHPPLAIGKLWPTTN